MLNKQDFNNAIYQNIEMVKGDTLSFNFELKGTGGDTPAFTFTCSENYNADPYFTATNDDGVTLLSYDQAQDLALYNVRIDPEKTSDLDLASYYYDLEMTLESDVITLMRGKLTLLYEVTR